MPTQTVTISCSAPHN